MSRGLSLSFPCRRQRREKSSVCGFPTSHVEAVTVTITAIVCCLRIVFFITVVWHIYSRITYSTVFSSTTSNTRNDNDVGRRKGRGNDMNLWNVNYRRRHDEEELTGGGDDDDEEHRCVGYNAHCHITTFNRSKFSFVCLLPSTVFFSYKHLQNKMFSFWC